MSRLASRHSITLTISGQRALWCRWLGSERIDEFVEVLPLEVEAGHEVHASRKSPQAFSSDPPSQCPWVSESSAARRELSVHLIVDSAQSEVLRIETSADSPGADRSRLAVWLQERRLMAHLRASHPDAVIRQGVQTSPLDSVWLSREVWPASWTAWLDRLQACGVLITRVSTSAEQLTERALAQTRDDVLFVLIGDHQQQHSLVRDGVVVFRRVVSVDGDDTVRTALTDSLNHLHRHLGVQSLALFPVGMSRALHGEWMSHDRVAVLLEEADGEGSTSCTASERLAEGDEAIARFLSSDHGCRRHSGISIPASGPVHDVLTQHVARQCQSRLRTVAVFSMVIASATVAFAAVQGFRSVEQASRIEAEQDRLTQRLSQVADVVRDLHPDAELADQFLLRAESFEPQRSSPEVMAWLADVMQPFPDIGLDSLDWRIEDTEERFWVLEFSGKVDDRQSLRVRQERFDSFVQAMNRLEEVAGVDVRLSPLARAAAASKQVVSAAEPDYQLRVNLHDS